MKQPKGQSEFNHREQNPFKPFNQKRIYSRLLHDFHNHWGDLKTHMVEGDSRNKSQNHNIELGHH